MVIATWEVVFSPCWSMKADGL